MTEIPESVANNRRKRINRLKHMIVSTIFVLLMIPNILCIVAFININSLNQRVDDLAARIDQIAVYFAGTQDGTEDDSIEVSSESVSVTPDEIFYYQEPDDIVTGDLVDDYANMRKVCLTFDDGPSSNTDEILDILAEYGVQATFFVNGKTGYDEQYQRIVDEGHTLAMHSYSHKYQELYYDLEAFEEDFFQIQSFLLDVTGVQCRFYRFPGGSSNTVCNVDMHECIDFLGQEDVVYFDWNVSSGDAARGYVSVSTIVNNVMGPIENNNWNTYVVLMHDAAGKETTVEALPIILERIQAMDDVIMVPITDTVHTVQHVLPIEEQDTTEE